MMIAQSEDFAATREESSRSRMNIKNDTQDHFGRSIVPETNLHGLWHSRPSHLVISQTLYHNHKRDPGDGDREWREDKNGRHHEHL
jgi:hypothetical protein